MRRDFFCRSHCGMPLMCAILCVIMCRMADKMADCGAHLSVNYAIFCYLSPYFGFGIAFVCIYSVGREVGTPNWR